MTDEPTRECEHDDMSWTALGAGLWECNGCDGWLVHVHQCVCDWSS